MDHMFVQNWILALNITFAAQDHHILLWIDNFSGHTLPREGFSHIPVKFFSLKLTPHVQLLDPGIIKILKTN